MAVKRMRVSHRESSIRWSKNQRRKTHHIERFNCTLRQRVSPLVRTSISFSKQLANHICLCACLPRCLPVRVRTQTGTWRRQVPHADRSEPSSISLANTICKKHYMYSTTLTFSITLSWQKPIRNWRSGIWRSRSWVWSRNYRRHIRVI